MAIIWCIIHCNNMAVVGNFPLFFVFIVITNEQLKVRIRNFVLRVIIDTTNPYVKSVIKAWPNFNLHDK
jgi:hypothetical protein